MACHAELGDSGKVCYEPNGTAVKVLDSQIFRAIESDLVGKERMGFLGIQEQCAEDEDNTKWETE